MKILFITPGCFDKGGISRYSRYQIDAIRQLYGKENIRVLSLLGEDEGSFENSFKVYWTGKNRNRYIERLSFIWQIFIQVLFWRPTIVHTAHVNFSGLVLLLSKLCGATTVLNTYGLEVWSGLRKDANWGLKNTHHVISDCHFTANYLENNKIRNKNSTTVIWDCVDLKKFTPCEKVDTEVLKKYNIPDPSEYFNILTLGRLSHGARHKGYERLLEVFKVVASRNDKARLIFAGKGDFSEKLKELVAETNLSDKVSFTGMVAEDDLTAVYCTATIFSLVSDRGKGRGEGIPLTPLEAMACGNPIIVGNHDGSQEAIMEEQNGFVIDPFDLDKHIFHIETLIKDKILLNKLEKGAIKVVQSFFSFKEFVHKHELFYKKIS